MACSMSVGASSMATSTRSMPSEDAAACAWKPWRQPRGYAQSVQQALSARSGGGLAATWARGVQAGSAGEPGELLEGLRMLIPKELKFEHSGGVKAMTDEQ